jgi:nitroreductase
MKEVTTMVTLSLTPDELLTTTRTVRKRLDLTRPVERQVIEECLRIAQQAPTASNMQNWHFVVVTAPATRAAIAAIYRKGWQAYRARGTGAPTGFADPTRAAIQTRVRESADYLVEHLAQVPVLVIPCISGRLDQQPISGQAAMWGTIGPATWSFMLAARARGLGTAWTTFTLAHERETAEAVGIPYAEVTQAGLIPVAYTIGTDFKPAPRDPLEKMVHWERW